MDYPVHLSSTTKNAMIGIAITASGTLFVVFGNLPTRVSILESNKLGIEARLESMDRKIDVILERMGR